MITLSNKIVPFPSTFAEVFWAGKKFWFSLYFSATLSSVQSFSLLDTRSITNKGTVGSAKQDRATFQEPQDMVKINHRNLCVPGVNLRMVDQ